MLRRSKELKLSTNLIALCICYKTNKEFPPIADGFDHRETVWDVNGSFCY